MKKILLSCSAIFSYLTVFSASGGPDTYGYIWKDSNEPNGPVYNWFDITQIGNPVSGLGDDNFVGPKPIGGPFQFYWYTVNQVWIGSNGYIAFNGGNLASLFPPIPQPGGVNNYITGMLADLTFLGPANQGRCYYYFNADSFCVSWVNVPFWANNAQTYTGSNSFQIILSRADSSITVNFKTQTGLSSNGDVKCGMENTTGQIGLQVFNQVYPPVNYTVKYYFPRNSTFIARDASAMWSDNPRSEGIFIKQNGPPMTMSGDVKNTGNTVLAPFAVTNRVLNQVNSTVVSNSATTPTLNPQQDIVFTYTNPFTAAQAGTYRAITTVTGAMPDSVPSNDSAVQEIVAIDTTQPVMTLNYNNNFSNFVGSSVSWNGGAGGVGMYFKPPFYPARIVASKFKETSVTTSAYSCYIKIYADNGPSGTPGTLLDSVAVLSSAINTAGVTTVNVSGNMVIGSGGVYLLWDMAGVGAQLGEDLTAPFSYQTYEVFQNIWSDYRDRAIKDFFLGLDIKKAYPEDVGVSRFVSPVNNQTISTPTQVKVYIKNYGPQPDNNYISVSYKLGLSGNTVTQAYTGGPILSGDSVLFTFTTMLTPPYSNLDRLCAWTSKTTDINIMNDSSCINVNLVGINEYETRHQVKIYPNPSTGYINFTFAESNSDVITLDIYDMLGNKVHSVRWQGIAAGKENTIDISYLTRGVYTYTIRSNNKFSSGKILKIE